MLLEHARGFENATNYIFDHLIQRFPITGISKTTHLEFLEGGMSMKNTWRIYVVAVEGLMMVILRKTLGNEQSTSD